MTGRPLPRKIRKSWSLLLVSLALMMTPPFTAYAQDSKLAEIAGYEGADREKRLIEGAKKEGELMFYSSIPVEDIAVLTAAFDKKYGVKVNLWRARSENVLQRIISESRSSHPSFDVVEGIAVLFA